MATMIIPFNEGGLIVCVRISEGDIEVLYAVN